MHSSPLRILFSAVFLACCCLARICRRIGEPLTVILDLDETLWHYENEFELSFYLDASVVDRVVFRPGASAFLDDLVELVGREHIYLFTAGTDEFARSMLRLLYPLDADPFTRFSWVFATTAEEHAASLSDGTCPSLFTRVPVSRGVGVAKDLDKANAVLSAYSQQHPDDTKPPITAASLFIDDRAVNIDGLGTVRGITIPPFKGDPSDRFLPDLLLPLLRQLATAPPPDWTSLNEAMQSERERKVMRLQECPDVDWMAAFRATMDRWGHYDYQIVLDPFTRCDACLASLCLPNTLPGLTDTPAVDVDPAIFKETGIARVAAEVHRVVQLKGHMPDVLAESSTPVPPSVSLADGIEAWVRAPPAARQ